MPVIFKKPVDRISKRWQPKEHDVIIALELIKKHIPMDDPFSLQWGESQKGVVRLRCKAWTGGRPWFVDIYRNNYFQVQIDNNPSERASGLLEMIVSLAKQLHLKITI